MKNIAILAALSMGLTACIPEEGQNSEAKDKAAVQRQQSQYQIAQPIPAFDWSLERDLLIQLYQVRNSEVTTHSVWRSNYGTIEGDCPSMGDRIPYDTSLTNPQQVQMVDDFGESKSGATIGQAEPNGVFASTNTAATWVFCIGNSGGIEPVYVESKVTVYPGPVDVDYQQNLAVRRGDATVNITTRN